MSLPRRSGPRPPTGGRDSVAPKSRIDRLRELVRPRPQRDWVDGHRVDLLINGEQFFPAVFEAVARARTEILIETFILFEDKVGLELHRLLIEAAQRGVSVDVLVDDYGSPDLSPPFLAALTEVGVRLRTFDPLPRVLGKRINMLRRMHRKIAVIDGEVAFVGGINFSADHLEDFGPEAKQDYSVRLRGPIVARIRRFVLDQIPDRPPAPVLPVPAPAGDAKVMFVVRDNRDHREDIERQYRAAIRAARREVLIANAYFFPGYHLLKALRRAARRGVKVRLILQGQPDMPIVKTVAELLHQQLLGAGVEIHEYCRRPLHGKVAYVDDHWCTVGSSNLDPLSLSLNLEANVMIRDPKFNEQLRQHFAALMADHCRGVERERLAQRSRWHQLLDTLAYYVTRWFPSWGGLLPRHRPRLIALAGPSARPSVSPATAEEAKPQREALGRAP